MRRHRRVLALLSIGLAACSTAGSQDASHVPDSMSLTSPAFADGAAIPAQYTCDGEDLSPPLAWTEVPTGVVGFALTVTDADAGDFVHWVLADIPGDARSLDAGQGDGVGFAGDNDFGNRSWGGPCPPSGTHRYVFSLYGLSGPTEHGSGVLLPADQLRYLMEGKVVATAEMTATYSR